jgi:L-aspartate oxidase
MIPAIRALPSVSAGRRREADVVIVGSGAAGIATAVTAAAAGLTVLMVTKDLVGGASPLAQGGLAAAIGPGDGPGVHAQDTMVAGAGLCDEAPVAELAAGSPAAIGWLVAAGARLEQRDLRLEGGHSHRRIVHSGDDASGAEVHRALLAALLASPVEVLDHTAALDLITDDDGTVAGISVLPGEAPNLPGEAPNPALPDGSEAPQPPLPDGNCVNFSEYRGKGHGYPLVGNGNGQLRPEVVFARAVVIAAGGFGQAFATTSNPIGATGDGIAIAARAGATLRDLEFVQFHPTVLYSKDATGQRPLITEALRGAGAVLRDVDGRPVMAGRHPLGDLAPRDIVAAASHECIERDGRGHVWLDATALGRHVVEDGFPTVTAACRRQGVDPVTDLIPVAPGAHYSCGGIAAGMDGRTSIPGLYAVGEAASTGVHGANRLASNSLVEAVIMGRNTAESVIRAASGGDRPTAGRNRDAYGPVGGPPLSRAVLAAAMSRYAGVVRDRDGLRELLRVATTVPAAIAPRAAATAGGPVRDQGADLYLDLELVETTNLHAVSVLIAAAALARTESRGCHRRRDFPQAWPQARHTLLRWTPDGLKVEL